MTPHPPDQRLEEIEAEVRSGQYLPRTRLNFEFLLDLVKQLRAERDEALLARKEWRDPLLGKMQHELEDAHRMAESLARDGAIPIVITDSAYDDTPQMVTTIAMRNERDRLVADRNAAQGLAEARLADEMQANGELAAKSAEVERLREAYDAMARAVLGVCTCTPGVAHIQHEITCVGAIARAALASTNSTTVLPGERPGDGKVRTEPVGQSVLATAGTVKDIPGTPAAVVEQSEIEKLRSLLRVAKCPSCDGGGTRWEQTSDDDAEWVQCQWCDERGFAGAAPKPKQSRPECDGDECVPFEEPDCPCSCHKPVASSEQGGTP